jgi:hypothetical protein
MSVQGNINADWMTCAIAALAFLVAWLAVCVGVDMVARWRKRK